MARRRTNWVEVTKHAAMGILVALTFYPFVVLILISFKNNVQFFHHPWSLTFPLVFKNYQSAFFALIGYVGNSMFISTVTCFGVVYLSAFSAYVFARFSFFAKEALFYAIVSLLMVPGILGLIPLFMIVKNLGLLNTYWALLLPYIASGQVLGIFLLRTFFASVPKDLFDAAEIDGAGHIRTFFSVAVPLCKPIMVTLAIINLFFTWNDVIWPLVVLSDDDVKTIAVGLLSFQSQFMTHSLTRWGPLFAGYVLASIPLLILFLVASRSFVEGLTSGAIKA